MRDADLPPTPGSFVSSLMRFASGGAVMVARLLSYLVAEQLRNSATQQPKTVPESSCLQSSRLTAPAFLVDFSGGFVHCSDDEVLQHLDVVRVDRFFIDCDAQQLLVA